MATKKTTTKTTAPVPDGAVPEAEFRAFQQETRDGMSTILDAIEKLASPITTPEQSSPAADHESNDAGDPNGFLPAQYVKIFQKYFDPADGFTARITFPEVDEQGRESGGITFTIFVPQKFSNVTPAYSSLYKVDLRTRALQPHNIAKGIDDWCKLVAKNLRYDKQVQTK